jgi:hypothetical protein
MIHLFGNLQIPSMPEFGAHKKEERADGSARSLECGS